jgi:hypothetical protein
MSCCCVIPGHPIPMYRPSGPKQTHRQTARRGFSHYRMSWRGPNAPAVLCLRPASRSRRSIPMYRPPGPKQTHRQTARSADGLYHRPSPRPGVPMGQNSTMRPRAASKARACPLLGFGPMSCFCVQRNRGHSQVSLKSEPAESRPNHDSTSSQEMPRPRQTELGDRFSRAPVPAGERILADVICFSEHLVRQCPRQTA